MDWSPTHGTALLYRERSANPSSWMHGNTFPWPLPTRWLHRCHIVSCSSNKAARLPNPRSASRSLARQHPQIDKKSYRAPLQSIWMSDAKHLLQIRRLGGRGCAISPLLQGPTHVPLFPKWSLESESVWRWQEIRNLLWLHQSMVEDLYKPLRFAATTDAVLASCLL